MSRIRQLFALGIILPVVLFSSGCAVQHGYVGDSGAMIGAGTQFTGASYIGLRQFCETQGCDYSIDSVSGIVHVRQGVMQVKVMPDSNISLVNGEVKKFWPQAEFRNNDIYIPPSFAGYLQEEVFELKSTGKRRPVVVKQEQHVPDVVRIRPALRKIVIDPGHGGKDPGALSRGGLKEKNVVLDIAKRLRRELLKRGDFDIIMTRDTDRFISLWKRSQIANKAQADLFVSIHANAARSRNAQGFEVYFLSAATDDTARAIAAAENEVISYEKSNGAGTKPPYLNATVWDMALAENRDESKELAEYICDTSANGLCVKNRGVKSARFYVLKGTQMPAVLIEVGFLSNYTEAKNLGSSAYRAKVARSIADGLLSYEKKFRETAAFTR